MSGTIIHPRRGPAPIPGMAIKPYGKDARGPFSFGSTLRKQLGQYFRLIRVPDTGELAFEKCHPKAEGARRLRDSTSIAPLRHAYNLQQGDVLPVVERDGLFVIQRPVRDAEAHDRAGEVPA